MHPRTFIAATLIAALGVASPLDLSAQGPLPKDSLVAEMELVFAGTGNMVTHTMTVLGHALDINHEEGGDSTVVAAAAILHDIGIPRAREIHGSTAGQYQEIEGPPIAREILTRLHYPPSMIDHICGIIANHHSDADPDIVNTLEFKILWDADWLVNFPGRHPGATGQEKEAAIEEIFKTKRGKLLARQLFLERPEDTQGGVRGTSVRNIADGTGERGSS